MDFLLSKDADDPRWILPGHGKNFTTLRNQDSQLQTMIGMK
jgi:glyoxylase-like metal-dependent hydrolase (beta-lactamase superfamily II)